MKEYRDNPDGEANQKATRENRAATLAAQHNKPTNYAKALHADRVAAQEAEGTPRPWKIHSETGIYDMVVSDQLIVCRCAGDTDCEARANAKLIVRAVNEHAALLEVAEAARFVSLRESTSPAIAQGDSESRRLCNARLERALAALAAVRAGSEVAK